MVEKYFDTPKGYVVDKAYYQKGKFHCKIKKDSTKCWKDLKTINGCFVTEDSKIKINCHSLEGNLSDEDYKNIAINGKVAKSMLAMAQISQLIPYYGEEVTQEEIASPYCEKWLICYHRSTKKFYVSCFDDPQQNNILVFHEEINGEDFLENNLQLVKEYFMVDD